MREDALIDEEAAAPTEDKVCMSHDDAAEIWKEEKANTMSAIGLIVLWLLCHWPRITYDGYLAVLTLMGCRLLQILVTISFITCI